MNAEPNTTINYIFFLKTKEDLDHCFYTMAEIFGKINISLIPIEMEDLSRMEKSKKNHLIVLRNDLYSGMVINEYKKSHLDSAMSAGRIKIYDVSAFSEFETAMKLENKNVYKYFQMPLNIKQLAVTIGVDYFKDRQSAPEWPGGKRAKLPSMNSEN